MKPLQLVALCLTILPSILLAKPYYEIRNGQGNAIQPVMAPPEAEQHSFPMTPGALLQEMDSNTAIALSSFLFTTLMLTANSYYPFDKIHLPGGGTNRQTRGFFTDVGESLDEARTYVADTIGKQIESFQDRWIQTDKQASTRR